MISIHDFVGGAPVSQRSSELDRRVLECLLDGLTPDEAIAELEHDGLHVPLDVIRSVVRSPLASRALLSVTRLRCRDWLLRTLRDLSGLDPQFMMLADGSGSSRETFLREYYSRNRPALFPSLAQSWPATALWSPTYLTNRCGHVMVEIMSGREGVHQSRQNVDDRLRKRVPFSAYVAHVYSGGAGNDVYLVSRNRFFDLPGTGVLLADLGATPYVTLENAGESVRLWFGPAGTFTGLHYDDVNQLIVVISGRKTFRLYSPLFSEFMGQSREWYADIDPRADGCASAIPEIVCSLGPGDALFLPVGWWHAVEATEPTIMLTFRNFGVTNAFPAR